MTPYTYAFFPLLLFCISVSDCVYILVIDCAIISLSYALHSYWNTFLKKKLAEGVLVVKKDVRAPKHPEIDVPNLQVMKALLSLKSRGYVAEQFSWQHYYYFLTDEGILFLRSYLHLPETVVPLTIAKATATRAARPERDERQERRGGEYRRSEWRNKSEAPAAAAH